MCDVCPLTFSNQSWVTVWFIKLRQCFYTWPTGHKTKTYRDIDFVVEGSGESRYGLSSSNTGKDCPHVTWAEFLHINCRTSCHRHPKAYNCWRGEQNSLQANMWELTLANNLGHGAPQWLCDKRAEKTKSSDNSSLSSSSSGWASTWRWRRRWPCRWRSSDRQRSRSETLPPEKEPTWKPEIFVTILIILLVLHSNVGLVATRK